LGLLALALPFLVRRLMRADVSGKAKRRAVVQTILLALLAMVFAMMIGRIVVDSFKENFQPAEVATAENPIPQGVVVVDATNGGAMNVNLAEPPAALQPKSAAPNPEQQLEARAKLKQAKAEFERVNDRYQQKLASQHELNQAQLGIELAEAELSGDSEQIDRVRLKQAREEFSRVAALHENKVISQYEFDKARLEVELAEARLAHDRVAVLRLQLKDAEDNYRRASELRREKLISESEFSKSQSALELAQQKLDQALQRRKTP
jgi:multidrug resistance efflux pump